MVYESLIIVLTGAIFVKVGNIIVSYTLLLDEYERYRSKMENKIRYLNKNIEEIKSMKEKMKENIEEEEEVVNTSLFGSDDETLDNDWYQPNKYFAR